MENESREAKSNEGFEKCCICGGTLQNGYANLFVDSYGNAARIDEQCHNAIDTVVHGKDARIIQSSLEYLSWKREYIHPDVQRYLDSYIRYGEQQLFEIRSKNNGLTIQNDLSQNPPRADAQNTMHARTDSAVSFPQNVYDPISNEPPQQRSLEHTQPKRTRARRNQNTFMNNPQSNTPQYFNSQSARYTPEALPNEPDFSRQSPLSVYGIPGNRREPTNTYRPTEQQNDSLHGTGFISDIQSRMDSYNPSLPVKSTRSLIGLIFLALLTLGIYTVYFWITYCRDVNRICKGDGKHTFNIGIAYALAWIIGLITIIVISSSGPINSFLSLIDILTKPGILIFIILFTLIGLVAMCIWVVTTQNRIVNNGHRYHARITHSGETVLAWQTVGILVIGFGPLIAQYIVIDSLNHLADAYNQASNLY